MTGDVLHVRAPARVDLSAGFGDVEPFCDRTPGYVVNVALTLGIDVALTRTTGRTKGGQEASWLPGRLLDFSKAQIGLADTFDVNVRASGLTPGSGLGSSGALSVGIVYALLSLGRRRPTPEVTVDLAVRAEHACGVFGGTQDQWASAMGGAGLVRRYRDMGARTALRPHRGLLGSHLAVVHPGGHRRSDTLINRVVETVSTPTMVRINDVSLAMASAISQNDLETAGRLMTVSRDLLSELDPGIVSPRVAETILATRGVLGAKPCGAGGETATWVALVRPDYRAAFEADMVAAGLAVLQTGVSERGVRVARGRGRPSGTTLSSRPQDLP